MKIMSGKNVVVVYLRKYIEALANKSPAMYLTTRKPKISKI